jgi:hypothetical protein
MSSPSSEGRQDDGTDEVNILARLHDMRPVDFDLTDFENDDVPSPPSLFVKKFLPEIFAQKKKFLAIPTKDKHGSFKRKVGMTHLYDLCEKYRIPKTGTRPDLEKHLLVFFFKKPEVFAQEPKFQNDSFLRGRKIQHDSIWTRERLDPTPVFGRRFTKTS